MLCVDDNVFKLIYDNYSNDVSYEQFAEKHHIANYVVSNKEFDTINRCMYVKKQERLYHMFKVVSGIINGTYYNMFMNQAKGYEDDGE